MNTFTDHVSRLVVLGMLAGGVSFIGQFALFTYLRPFLETVTRVDVARLSLMLLALGVTRLIGTMTIGRSLQIDFYGTLAAIPALMAVMAVALIAFGASAPVVALLLGI
jgi:predicted MFS family arabinose efflux permease